MATVTLLSGAALTTKESLGAEPPEVADAAFIPESKVTYSFLNTSTLLARLANWFLLLAVDTLVAITAPAQWVHVDSVASAYYSPKVSIVFCENTLRVSQTLGRRSSRRETVVKIEAEI